MDTEQRAARARQLKDDPILRELLDGLRNEAISVWSRTKVADQQQREFAWMMVRSIDRIEAGLQAIVDDSFISNLALVRAPE